MTNPTTKSIIMKTQLYSKPPCPNNTNNNKDRTRFQVWKRAMLGWGTAIQSRMYHGTTTTTTTRTFSVSSSSSSSIDGGGSGSGSGSGGRISAPRASRAVDLLPTYLADARAVERYSPSTPNGALQLSVAENQMLEDLLVPSIMEFSSTVNFPSNAIYYQPTHGRESFRLAMARYLEDILDLTKSMDEDGIVVGAGCNAVLENLCICLAEPGEGVMIPTPYYAAFEFDLVARAGMYIVVIYTPMK